MLRLIKYLRPYLLFIFLAIALLFIQANADLALPDYLSRIVNNGIQQGGVESAVPLAVRTTTMDNLTLFMTEEQSAQVLEAYTLIQPGSEAADEYLEPYSILQDQSLYVLTDLNRDEIDALNPILSKAFVAMSGIEGMIADPDSAGAITETLGFDISQLPTDTDPFEMLSMLSAAQRTGLTARIDEAFAALGDNMLEQMAIAAVKSEYEAIGVDTGQLQNSYVLRTGGVMLLISLLGGACTIAVGYLASRTAAGAARDIRLEAFKKVESFSSAEFDKFSTASLITRSTNDITQIQMLIFMFMRMVLYAPIIGIGGVIRAIDKSANMWWIIALAVIVLLGLILIVFSISLPKFKRMQSLIDRLNLL